MVGIGGPYPQLKMRGPGTVGLSFAAHFSRYMLYLNKHDPKVLCEEVDYVSAPGHTEGRQKYVRSFSKGPSLIVTPQAVFDFSDEGLARLRSITPGYSVEDVRAHTGFEFDLSEDFGETPSPTPEQLDVIHNEIDPHGVLADVQLGTW